MLRYWFLRIKRSIEKIPVAQDTSFSFYISDSEQRKFYITSLCLKKYNFHLINLIKYFQFKYLAFGKRFASYMEPIRCMSL